MFKKKKKGKEENQTDLESENIDNEKGEGGEVAVGKDSAASNEDSADALALKPTLIIAVIAMMSVMCAFVFVSKMNSSPEAIVLDLEETESMEKRQQTTPGEVAEEKTDKLKKKEKKKEKKKKKGNDTEKKDNESGEEGEGEVQGNIIVPLESIVVNLGGVGSRRYLRVLINLEVEDEESKVMIQEKIVMLRDKMISLLSAKSAKEIESEGSLLRLRLEIKNILNEVLEEEIIKQVYFSDFIIQ